MADKIAVPQQMYRKEDLEKPALSFFNLHMKQIVEAVNRLAGNHGPVQVNDELAATTVTAGTSKWSSGQGSPEGVVAGKVGDLYTRTDGGAGTTLYVKESIAQGATKGWTGK